MTVLVITNRPLRTTSNGYDLRVWHLCRAMAQQEKLVLLPLPLACVNSAVTPDLEPEHLFSAIVSAPAITAVRPSFWRILRLSEDSFFSFAYPGFQHAVSHQIEYLCAQHSVTKIVVFGSNLVGLTRRANVRKHMILDVCDSVTLTLEREQTLSKGRQSLLQRALKQLMLRRWRALEAMTPQWFDQVVTINHSDTETIRLLSGRRANLSTVPNGIDSLWRASYQEGRCGRRAVAFWGNLSFPPNSEAVRFFYWKVYLPYLKPAGVGWCIIGRDPEDWLVRVANQDEGIRLAGYVENLRALLAEYPVMVNPMLSGSGMKNKVLEAHALGLAVVSTGLGMESVEGSTARETYLQADDASVFSSAIFELLADERLRLQLLRKARNLIESRYTWDIVGAQWLEVIGRTGPGLNETGASYREARHA
jgi:glycosyltransferase involved in cell wall biosynthesis